MTAIDRATLETTDDVASSWRQIASGTLAWAASNGVSLRDTIVLLPFAALLPHARAAFAAESVWMPRIETPLTLAGALGPPTTAGAGQLSFDPTADRLTVAQLLRAQAWGQAWARSDPRAFEQAVAAVVDTAHELARAAALHAPEQRTERWAAWRQLLSPLRGPGARQRALAQLALEWASQAPAPATDRLYALQPAAWVAVQAGGADPFATSLFASSAAPCLCLDLDPSDAVRFCPPGPAPAFALCDDFEHEAQCSAAQVLAHVRQHEVPVALISQDRVLVRRVRALLERQRITLHDETGWKLSTTRAAAQLMSLLKAARPNATTDSVLDWLKSGTRWSAPSDGALAQFEADCRRHQRARVTDLVPEALAEPASGLWADVSAMLAVFYASSRLPLTAWLQRTAHALLAAGMWHALQADDAGRQVLSQLHLEADGGASPWAQRLDTTMNHHEFVGWVDSVLEQASFVPTGDRTRPAEVIITPLARAMLRPFGAVVCPGADARRLGAGAAPHALLPESMLAELGLPDAAQRQADEARAFAQLLRLPRLTLLRRRRDADEPLGDSPLVERMRLALARRGDTLREWTDSRIESVLAATPIAPSAGVAPALLPRELSASACEALRACPYRFFALNVLRAREADELDEEVEKRDYGTWLHAVLHAFHAARRDDSSAAEDVASLHRLADEKRAEHGLAAADFVPFGASFEAFVPRYVAWQRARDAAGARWQQGEQRHRMNLPHAEPFVLEGIIDRVDQIGGVGDGRVPCLQLVDYKTGSASGLKEKVREPLEDTQLAFYAALMRSQRSEPLRAAYLALDGREIEEIEHKGVEASAELLLDGLAAELLRLQAGEGMAPLGEASACDFCAARGVCRRDHWSIPADTVDVDRNAVG
jgi:ATP-dependent helicase/nuclease subunit B